MPHDITPISMWHRMKLHCQFHQAKHTHGRPMKNFMVTFVVSPTPEECKGWERSDWERFSQEVLKSLDHADLSKKKGCKKCTPTNFRNSMSVAALHRDSKSGILHLHIDCCRIDMNGRTNDCHQIHERAMKAAEDINRRHGWVLPEKIREDRAQVITNDCLEVLRMMQTFNKFKYFEELEKKGYKVKPIIDSGASLRGYTIQDGASVFKASELGKGRNLTATRLEDTWRKLHKNDAMKVSKPSPTRITLVTPATPKPHPTIPVAQPVTQTTKTIKPVVTPKVEEPTFTTFNVKADGKVFACNIPDAVVNIFDAANQTLVDELWSTTQNVADTAMLLFCGYIEAATNYAQSCGGGGSTTNNKGWGRDKDENDEEFARRCCKKATSMHTRRRGLKR